MATQFYVVPPAKTMRPQRGPGVYLMQDRWDDYGFQTQYHLYVFTTNSDELYVGAVKILKRGQAEGDGLQITKDFAQLGEDFVSIGASLDYYARLGDLGNDKRGLILDALRDVVRHPDLQAQFVDELGWRKSLFRDQTDEQIEEFLTLSRAIESGDYESVPSDDLRFTFHPYGWSEPFTFDFSPKDDSLRPWLEPRSPLPRKLIALIGRNGTGKSTVMARLARVAHSSFSSRRAGVFDRVGRLEPIGLGFPRIVTVSYSAFDSFALPGSAPREDEPDERRQIIKDTRNGEGRFVFCGLRDVATELEELIDTDATAAIAIGDDRVRETRLKSIKILSDEFARTVDKIRQRNRFESFRRCLSLLVTDPSFGRWDDAEELLAFLLLAPEEAYLNWSTGHKICLQVTASLCAHVVPRSLVLIDEPEMHLHPPLLAVLMHVVRYVLDANGAFCIVATHSPVVVQETLSRDVLVVRREGELASVKEAAIETFAENVGTLTSEIFGLNTGVTDFHRVLDELVASGKSLEGIEAEFKPYGLSKQGRAYVMSHLKSREK